MRNKEKRLRVKIEGDLMKSQLMEKLFKF